MPFHLYGTWTFPRRFQLNEYCHTSRKETQPVRNPDQSRQQLKAKAALLQDGLAQILFYFFFTQS